MLRHTFIADRPVRSLKDKVHALTSRLSQQRPRAGLVRLNQIMRRLDRRPGTADTIPLPSSAPTDTTHGLSLVTSSRRRPMTCLHA